MRRALRLLPLLFLLPPAVHAATEDVELRVMVFDPTSMPEGWRELQRIAREFEAEHPGVTVTLLSEAGGGDQLAKLKILLAARQPLDISWIDVVEFSSFLDDGVLLDLQPYLDRDPTWNPEDWYPAPLNAFRGRDGHLYGLPSTFTPYVMYYNRDLLEEAGVAVPGPDWTWDDLRDIAQRCSRPPDRFGISITQWLQALAPWIWQNGGDFLSADGTRCTLDTPEAIEAVRFLTDLFHVDRTAATDATYQAQLTEGLFQAGRVALYGPVGYWETFRFKTITDFHWDVLPLPRRRRAATSIALRSYVGIARTEHPQLVAELLQRIAGESMARTLARVGNGVPALRRAANSPDFLKPDVAPDSEQVFLDVLEHARTLPVHTDWREIESIVEEDLQGCLIFRSADAETTCRDITAKVDRFLERSRRERERPRAPLLVLGVITALLTGGLIGAVLERRRALAHALLAGEEQAGYAFLLPWALGFALLVVGPMLASLVLSMTAWSPIRPLADARWMGLGHYLRLLEDERFWQSLKVTALFSALSVPLSLAVALGLALIVRRGLALFRTLYYTPVIVSAVAVGILWRWILGPGWLEFEHRVVPGFVLMSLWTVGAPMLIFLAGLQGIDRTLYEAARLDGASRWRQFLHVTLPQLTPMILINLLIGVINASQMFAQPLVMTNGGPADASLFYVLYLYMTAFRFQHMGYASALGWVLFVVLLLVTVLILRHSRRWVHYEGDRA